MHISQYIISAVVGYLLGSIPTGYLMARARGVDIRTIGSGNIGATNVFRVLGKTAGIVVLLFDAAKGYAACHFPHLMWGNEANQTAMIIAGVAAILGHNYTCWLRFKGGKGIATSAGVLLAWIPGALGIIFVVWLIVFAVSRYVSLASIAAAVALPFAVWYRNESSTMLLITTIISALAIWKHRGNIRRLRDGTENRVGKKKGLTP